MKTIGMALLMLACGCGPALEPAPDLHVRLSASPCAETPCAEELAPAAANINGGFEVLDAAGIPDGWVMLWGTWPADAALVAPGHTGAHAVKFDAASYATYGFGSRAFNALGAAFYVASAWIWWPSTDPAGPPLYLAIQWYDSAGAPLRLDALPVGAVLGGAVHVFEGAVPSGAMGGRFEIRRHGNGYAHPTIDDAQVLLFP